jgi:hypothetical protein
MDTDSLVDRLLFDGEKLLLQLPKEGFPVVAGLWVKPYEEDKWLLYIVSPAVEAEGLSQARKRLKHVMREMSQPFWVETRHVRLVGATSEMGKDVLARYGKSTGPLRAGGKLGGAYIESAYLYALPAKVAG